MTPKACSYAGHPPSPSGLVLATDAGLESLLRDLDKWNDALTGPLRFTDAASSSKHAGLLHLFYSCVCMLFWRVFMRLTYTVPAHLSFSLTVERWTGLVKLTRESIEWLDLNERLYDVWMMVSYCATGCALVQVRRNTSPTFTFNPPFFPLNLFDTDYIYYKVSYLG